MLIFLYLAFLFTALYFVGKVLGPEFRKSSIPKPQAKAKFEIQSSEAIDLLLSDGDLNRVMKLETLLAEKSKNIQVLQTELQSFLAQIREFDKVKVLLDDEIQRLREQNRVLRSELGIPAASPRENSVI